ncbi:MAG: YraN family protein [Actinomycetes bacterium]
MNQLPDDLRQVRLERSRSQQALGRYGESVAARHLVDDGFVVLERNWRCHDGEIDIVAQDGDVLVICEVKTRSNLNHGSPFEAITQRKLHRLERLGFAWIRVRGMRPKSMRIDIVSIVRPSHGRTIIEHVRGLS